MIDFEALREALAQECYGAFFGGGFGGAMAQLSEIQNASPEELLSLAQEIGIDLSRFETLE